jgi:peptidyl-tRNA hydrolase, PTH1 family
MIRLFVGLGNPGPEYEDTRHNAGFWWIDALARGLKVTPQLDVKYFGLVARVNDAPGADGPIWLLQPMTYMNLSGKSVAALARFFKIAPEEILAIHDELEIAPGEHKLKQGGGNAGHNGLKDMQAQLGSGNFWRLRLGIGHPGHRDEVAGYVLRKPPLAERQAVEDSIGKSLEAFKLMTGGDMAKAVALLHAKPPRPKPPRPANLPAKVPSKPGAEAAAPTAGAPLAATGVTATTAATTATNAPTATPAPAVPTAPPPSSGD